MAENMEYEPSEAFDFSNSIRNVALSKMGLQAPKLVSTGTTIVAVVCKVCSNENRDTIRTSYLGCRCYGR
jgi:hypothetical protein